VQPIFPGEVMNRVRTALIGCGKVGRIHAEALNTLPESDLVAVCDSDPARAEDFARRYHSRPFTNVATMIRECEVASVFICTPHPLHARPAIEAAGAGAHVLVEKPLAASLEDCDAIITEARRNEVKLGVISQRRWFEPVRRMKQAILSGKIGRPLLGGFTMYSWRDQAYYQSDPWRGRWDTEGGGVLINQAPHMLDLLIWLMDDEVTEVCGYWANLNHPYVEVEDSAVAIMRFARGGLGAVVASLSQQPGIHTKVHIHGSNGSSIGVETDRGATFIAGMSAIAEPPLNDLWTIPGETHLLERFRTEDRARFALTDPVKHYHALQIQDFLQAILQDRSPEVTGEDGRRVVALIQAIYRSNHVKKPVGPSSLN
jgi:UDP-N-acetyl-2-amino-2-deoxyglucuronate dehydrogenase